MMHSISSMIIRTDIVILSRSYMIKWFIPLAVVYFVVFLKYLEVESEVFLPFLVTIAFLGSFENMFTRCKNEYNNYSLAAIETKKVVIAKNASNLMFYLGSSLSITCLTGIFSGFDSAWYIENCVTIIVISPLLLIAGNLMSERRLITGKTGYSFRNGLMSGIIIMTGLILFKSISIIWDLAVGASICGLLFLAGLIVTIVEISSDLRKHIFPLEMN